MYQQTIDALLDRIVNMQSQGDAYFAKGMFASYRSNRTYNYHRPDTNIFFSAITVFTLHSVIEHLPLAAQQKVDSITHGVVANYPQFRNKDGLDTYNFYGTNPSRHFPHGRILYKLDHFRLADDVDDTAMVYLTQPRTQEQLLWFKDKLAYHANGARGKMIKNTFDDYKALEAYTTWMGKTMYNEFDACVLSNLMYFIYQYKLPLNHHDYDTLKYIASVVSTNRYIDKPFRCAHSYPRATLIVYHIARLIAAFNPEGLRHVKDKLIADAQMLLAKEVSIMDRLLLSTALLGLNVQVPAIDVLSISDKDLSDFSFFVAGMLTAYEFPLTYKTASTPLVRMNWTCPAHANALLVEYLVRDMQYAEGHNEKSVLNN